jgi:hypothetical protein
MINQYQGNSSERMGRECVARVPANRVLNGNAPPTGIGGQIRAELAGVTMVRELWPMCRSWIPGDEMQLEAVALHSDLQ